MKHKLFIGSSVEGLKYARALQRNLAYDSHSRIWNQGIFRASNYVLEDLLAALSENEFGAFVFLPEDVSIIRGNREPAVRDNLIFELGMFVGRLGRKRAFFIKPQRCELHLPSDLKGINACEFDPDDTNLVSGMGAAASEISDLMKEINEREVSGQLQRATVDYERDAVYQQYLRADPHPLIRGHKYTRNDVITTYGDVRILEKWEDIRSYSGEPITELRARFTSRAGRQADCKCESLTENQSVTLKWRPTNEELSESVFVFDPPISSQAISFRVERYVFNGVSFTEQDRLEVTRGKSAEEELRVMYRHAWDSCLFQVKFPEHRFPKRFRASAFDKAGLELLQESEFADTCLDPFPETQNLLFKLQRPLPGVRYQVNWVLPEGHASLFSDIEQGFVDEVTRRLLGLRMKTGAHAHVAEALADARAKLTNLAGADPSESIQVALYLYDRQKAGLVCTSTLDADYVEANWDKYFFKPGRGVIGTAFRRRKTIVYIRDQWSPELDVYEPVTDDDENVRPHFVVCVPLFYVGHPERSLATLSFECRSTSPSFLSYLAGADAATQIQMEFKDWYTQTLARAVGVHSSHTYWHGAAHFHATT